MNLWSCVVLCRNANQFNLPQVEADEAFESAILEKLRIPEEDLPRPGTLQQWTDNFSIAPEFTFADLFMYLIE